MTTPDLRKWDGANRNWADRAVLLCLLALALAPLSWAQTIPNGTIIQPSYAGYNTVLINELQSFNTSTAYDSQQRTGAWIELYNPGDLTVSLETYALSDNYYKFRQWRFPPTSAIHSKQYLLVWMDGGEGLIGTSEIHSSLGLNPRGGSLALTTIRSGKPLIVDYVDYPALGEDLSYGLIPSSPGIRKVFTQPTPRKVNRHLPPLVINEWFITPPSEAGWLELYNAGRESLDLKGLSLRLSSPELQVSPYVIPKTFLLEAGGFTRVWADGSLFPPANDPKNLHLPWKLPSQPFTLSLVLPDGTLISEAVSEARDPKRPEARYPDGGKQAFIVNLATPGGPNVGLPRLAPELQPLRVRERSNVVWRVSASGTRPLSYRWFKGLTEINRINSPELKLPSVSLRDEGTYRVVVSNPAGQDSSTATLDVLEYPKLTVDAPIDLSVSLGKALSLPTSIAGTGPFQFQWKRNGVNIPEARGQNYSKSVIDLEDGGSYTAVIRNGAGAVLSVPVRVLIDVPVVRGGDDFADRIALSRTSSGSVRSSNRTATREPGEPAHAGNKGGHSVWFSWTPPVSGVATLHTRGSTFDTLLAVYAGKSLTSLQPIESDDDRGGYYTSELRFNASNRMEYLIAVDGFGGDTNDFLLSWRMDLESPPIPVILRHPVSQTQILGKEASFSVSATGNRLKYQWFFKGKPIADATKEFLILPPVSLADVGPYWVTVQSADQTQITSHAARLEVGSPTFAPSEDKYEPPSRRFSFPGLGDPGLADLGLPVAAGSIGYRSLSLLGSATSESEPPPCGQLGGASRYIGFDLAGDTEVIIDTIGSAQDTVLSVYSLNASAEFVYVDCSYDSSNSLVRFPGQGGTTYYAFVDRADGFANENNTWINWRFGTPPVLLSPTPPSTNTVDSGQSFSLPISVASVPSLMSFQWKVDDEDILGGTTAKMSVTGASPDDSGTYSIILSNAMGSVTGVVAQVHVRVPLILSVAEVAGKQGKDIRLNGSGEQGFWVETSTDLVNWCAFAVNYVPLSPFDYLLTLPESHPQLFFRCTPWPRAPEDSPVPCTSGFP